MSHYVETMAYSSNIKPWHGLGTEVEPNMTVEEMLQAAQLNWQVSSKPVHMFVNGEGKMSLMNIPGHKAIVRDFDSQVYQIASDRYKPIQNSEVLEFFREYTEAGEMSLETAGSLKQGAIVWGLAKINESFTLAGGDKLEGYLLLANSHDGSLSFTAKPTSVAVVCWNTLQMSLKDGQQAFAMRHTRKLTPEIVSDAKSKLGISQKALAQLKETSEFLADSKVDAGSQIVKQYLIQLTQPDLLAKIVERQERVPVSNVLDSILSATEAESRFSAVHQFTDNDLNRVGKGILDSILTGPGQDLESRKDTWWGVVNGATYYADHVSNGRGRDAALTSAWFGQKAGLKQQALELAVEYAKAVN